MSEVIGNMTTVQNVRARFNLIKVAQVSWNPEARLLTFQAVSGGSPEENTFARYTPNGTLEMTVDNPATAPFFELGGSYYLDFTRVPEKA